MAEPTIARHCPICNSVNRTELRHYKRDHWIITKCDDCGGVYLANPVTYEALEVDFAWERTYSDLRTQKEKERTALHNALSGLAKKLSQRFRTPFDKRFQELFGSGRVLDIGCGGGTTLPSPIVPFGIEVSKALAEMADAHMRQRGGYCLNTDAINGMSSFTDGMFDGVLIHSFLEHEVEPLKLLQHVARVLKKDGKAYVRVPNFNSLNRVFWGARWPGFRYPDHVNYFTAASLQQICMKAGLSAKIRGNDRLTFDDNIKAVLTHTA
jgi:SAM-dependent methyltransferase